MSFEEIDEYIAINPNICLGTSLNWLIKSAIKSELSILFSIPIRDDERNSISVTSSSTPLDDLFWLEKRECEEWVPLNPFPCFLILLPLASRSVYSTSSEIFLHSSLSMLGIVVLMMRLNSETFSSGVLILEELISLNLETK